MTIKVQFAPRHHKYFNVSRADLKTLVNLGDSPAMPAIPLSPEDLDSQAILRTDFVELHFHEPKGLSFPQNKRRLHKAYSFFAPPRHASSRKLYQEASRPLDLLGQMRSREK